MTERDPINDYLQELARQLPARSRRADRVLHEINDHLRTIADDLISQGMDRAAAAAKAIERLGSPTAVRQRFDLESPIESEVDAMIRYLLMAAACLTFAFGAVFLLFSAFDDARYAMFITKIVASAIIMASSSILFFQGWTTKRRPIWQSSLALASALMSISLASAGAVFTAHLGLVTGDWEMYAFFGAGLLMLQGVLGTLHLLATQSPNHQLAA